MVERFIKKRLKTTAKRCEQTPVKIRPDALWEKIKIRLS
jgi:hypothetical protein